MRLTETWWVDGLLLLSVVLFLFVKYVSRNHGYWKKRGVFSVEPTPLFGNFYDVCFFRVTVGEYLGRLYNMTAEPFFGIYVFGTPHLVLRSPEIIKQVMVKDFQYFTDRTIFAGDHDTIGKTMLFLSKNPEWKAVRTKMTPVFTSGKLKAMQPLINSIGCEMSEYLAKVASKQECSEVKEICSRFSTDVIARCAFGINAHSFDDEDAKFRAVGRMLFDFRLSTAIQQTSAFFMPTLSWLFRMKLFDIRAYDFLRDVFWNTIRQREATRIKGNDLIDLIVELKKNEQFCKEFNFENDKVVSQAVQFFAAGFETTSSTMAFTLYELCLQPRIQNRLRAEITDTLTRDGKFTYENITQMKYLHMCISETLRKYPVLPFLDRRCNGTYKVPGTDVVIEKGTPVYIPMFGLHYDPRYFPEPQKYDPERFSEERVADIVPFSYLPFGDGPRNCIGERFGMMSTKLGLIYFLSEFEVGRIDSTPVPVEFEPRSFILASKVGLPMKVTRANTKAA